MSLRIKALIITACIFLLLFVAIVLIMEFTRVSDQNPSLVFMLMLSFLVTIAAFCTCTFIYLDKWILKPVHRMCDDIDAIGQSGRFTARLDIEGGEEFSSLGYSVNSMLDDLEKAQTSILESEVKYRELVQKADSIIMRIDPDGRILFINDFAQDFFGYSEEELLGKCIIGTIQQRSQFSRTHLCRQIQELAMHPERHQTTEVQNTKRSGEMVWVAWTYRPIYNEEGDVSKVLCVGNDITEVMEIEEDLRHKNEELDSYASVVSHDLRSPLASVSMAMSLLRGFEQREGEADGSLHREELFQMVENNVEKACSLVEDLLALAEIGTQPIQPVEVDVDEVIRQIRSELAAEIMAKDARITTEGELGSVRANPTHIMQLFSNLISNSLKHCGRERPVVAIERLESPAIEYPKFRVRDNGRGVPPELVETAFKPFTKSTDGGTGIGLAIVDKIIQTYGGDMELYNQGGACFEFTIREFTCQAG